MTVNYSKTIPASKSTSPGKQLSSKLKRLKGILSLDAADSYKELIAEEIAKKHAR